MRAPLVALSLILLAGCYGRTQYDVYATGYTGGIPTSIAAGATVAVVEDPRAANPLLEQEVAAKVQRALADRGFRPAPPSEASVTVTLRYGTTRRTEHGESSRYVPGVDAQVKDSAGKVIGTVSSPGTTVQEPSSITLEQQWLTLTALDGRQFRDSRGGKPLWIGETKASQTNLDLRRALDYLIVPTAAAFGRNLSQSRWELRPDDPAVRAVRGT